MPGVGLLFGPLLIGVFLNTILYGVVVVQAYNYHQNYKKDVRWVRYFVLYLLLCETINTGFDIGLIYEPLVTRYATPRATTRSPIMISADPVVTVLISTSVQMFFAWRIKVITGSKLLTGIICFFSICSWIGGVATTICDTIITQYANLQQYDGAVITWFVSSATADICIASSLVWSLHKRRTGHSATDDIINRIIRLAVQTGVLTAFSGTLGVILFVTLPRTTLNFIPCFMLTKLYTNSLMSSLNTRAGMNSLQVVQEQGNVLFGTTVSSIKFTKPPNIESGMVTSNAISFQVPRDIITSDSSLTREGHDLDPESSATKTAESSQEGPGTVV